MSRDVPGRANDATVPARWLHQSSSRSIPASTGFVLNSPCRSPLPATIAFPSAPRGPVDNAALRRFASTFTMDDAQAILVKSAKLHLSPQGNIMVRADW